MASIIVDYIPLTAAAGRSPATLELRALARERMRALGYAYVAMGTNQESIAEGQQLFASGKRVEWKLR